jgi:multidrug efflux system membrane fusion protein
MNRTPGRTAALAVLTLASAVIGVACTGNAANTPATPPPPPVVVGQAVRRTVPVSLHGIGNVESVASVAVRSRVAGQILRVHIKDGADVSQGQRLFTIDPAPYEIAAAEAEARLARDQALLKKAENDAVRSDKLVQQGFVSREQYESATSQAASLAATIKADEAAVKDARLSLSYCTIQAPISGRAGTVNLRAGSLVKINDDPPLVTLLTVRPVNVTFSVPEKYLGAIRAHAASKRLDVLAAGRGQEGEGRRGTLAFIDNTVDTTTGTIRLKAEFANDDLGLWPGQFVDVELILSQQSDALLVPTTAIQVGQQGSYVFVVSAEGTAEMRPVVVDRAIGDETVIASGLEGGETVITDGQLRVVPGGKVAAGPAS